MATALLGTKGERIRGHEFRYSDIRADGIAGRPGCVYSVTDGSGGQMPAEGYLRKKTLASYIHVHFGSNERIAGRFVDFALKGRD